MIIDHLHDHLLLSLRKLGSWPSWRPTTQNDPFYLDRDCNEFSKNRWRAEQEATLPTKEKFAAPNIQTFGHKLAHINIGIASHPIAEKPQFESKEPSIVDLSRFFNRCALPCQGKGYQPRASSSASAALGCELRMTERPEGAQELSLDE